MKILSKPLFLREIFRTINGTFDFGDVETSKINSITLDSRKDAELFIAIKGEKFDGHNFLSDFFSRSSSRFAIVDKDFKYTGYKNNCLIRVKDTRKALGELAKLYKTKFNVKTIAITGSVGKTTLKEMINSVVSKKYSTLCNYKNFNNDIGVPLTLFELQGHHEIAILEMGMNSLGEIKHLSEISMPDIAIISNIGSAHIGKLGSKGNILKAKFEITYGLTPEGVLILNGDDTFLSKINTDFKTMKFGIYNKNLDVYAENINYINNSTHFIVKSSDGSSSFNVIVNGVGEHLIYSTLATICIANLFNIPIDIIRDCLKNLNSVRQVITKMNEVIIIDDCYNASPDSMKNAILNTAIIANEKGTIRKKIAVLASMLELGGFSKIEHENIAEFLVKSNFDYLITLGHDAKIMHHRAIELGLHSQHFSDHQSLLEGLKNIVQPNDIILIKGSNSMKLDIVVRELIEFLSVQPILV